MRSNWSSQLRASSSSIAVDRITFPSASLRAQNPDCIQDRRMFAAGLPPRGATKADQLPVFAVTLAAVWFLSSVDIRFWESGRKSASSTKGSCGRTTSPLRGMGSFAGQKAVHPLPRRRAPPSNGIKICCEDKNGHPLWVVMSPSAARSRLMRNASPQHRALIGTNRDPALEGGMRNLGRSRGRALHRGA